MLTASVSDAQIFERWQQDIVQQYGIIADIGFSGFTADSSGYTPSALPYAGGFVSWEFRRQVELQGWVQFTMNSLRPSMARVLSLRSFVVLSWR